MRMMAVKGIEELCLKLTDEERELHKDLIEECIKREEQINKFNGLKKQQIDKLISIGNEIAQDLERIKTARDQIIKSLRSIPEKKHQSKQTENITENSLIH
jgi:hypothetical protein